MELGFDFESPQNRVITWLSQTDVPASIQNFYEPVNSAGKYNDVLKEFSKSVDCSSKKLYIRSPKSGPKKYFGSVDNECAFKVSGNLSQESTRNNRLDYYEENGHKFFLPNDERASIVSETESQESSRNMIYCDAERITIIRYIVDKKLFSFVKGNTIWKQMEKEGICFRTWQSMKTQFQKYIYPRLKDFALTDSERSCFEKSMINSPTKKVIGCLSPGQRGWRKNCKFYTFVEDALILYYILEKDRYEFAYGNTLWLRMESKRIVPDRSWHSMKSRYKNFLSKYVDRATLINKYTTKLKRKTLDPCEKVRLLQDFMVDHLSDIAATMGCISESNENMEELRHLGLDPNSFFIPLPVNNPCVSEREVIKYCVREITQQLDKKFNLLMEYANKTTIKCKEIMNVFSPKYSANTDVFKLEDKFVSPSDKNYDLSVRVQYGLKISTPDACSRNRFQSSLVESINKPYTIVNSEQSACASPIRLDSSQSSSFERSVQLTEKLHTDVKDLHSNEEMRSSNFLLDSPWIPNESDVQFLNSATHKKQPVDKALSEVFRYPEITVETNNLFQNNVQQKLINLSQYKTEHKKRGKGKHSNKNTSALILLDVPENLSTKNSVHVDKPYNQSSKGALSLKRITYSSKKNEKKSKETNKSNATINSFNFIDISNDCEKNEMSSVCGIGNLEQGSKLSKLDMFKYSLPPDSSLSYVREPRPSYFGQSQQESEEEPELRLRLSEESEEEPELRLRLSEESEEETELRLQLSDESEEESALVIHLSDESGRESSKSSKCNIENNVFNATEHF